MKKQTALYDQHLSANAKIVDFAGWQMPIHYGSLLAEHKIVREQAGMFDVSHMQVIDINGNDVIAFVRYLLANDVAKLVPGRALYSCMLAENGGIIDDLIVYYIADDFIRIIVNAGTADKDLQWLQQSVGDFQVTITANRDLSILAVQGPEAIAKVKAAVDAVEQQQAIDQLTQAFDFSIQKEWMFARTGYTGEVGLEIILPHDDAVTLWQALLEVGVSPCGLGARDTLRLEAGLNLYGNDMHELHTPLEVNLTWTVDFKDKNRQFIGRGALEKQLQQGVKHKLVGLELLGKGILRSHQQVCLADGRYGETTSGTYSPTLNKSIAMARVPVDTDGEVSVKIRDKNVPAKIVNMPFFKKTA